MRISVEQQKTSTEVLRAVLTGHVHYPCHISYHHEEVEAPASDLKEGNRQRSSVTQHTSAP